jgi:hypothetical protein
MAHLTQDELMELLTYNPRTGLWQWVHAGKGRKSCYNAGSINSKNRRKITVKGKCYYATQLAVLYMTGEFPLLEVDHADRDTLNDKWENLRLATHSENMANTGRYSNNKSGLKWVSWNKERNKWCATVKKHHIAFSDCPASAYFIALVISDKLYGEFSRAC